MVLWENDWNDALADAAAGHKQVLVEFERDSSKECRDLAKKGWSRMDIADAAGDYEAVMVDIDAHPELATQFGVRTVPSLLVVDAKSQTIIRDGRNWIYSGDALLGWLRPGSEPAFKVAIPQDDAFDLQENPLSR